MAAVGKPAHDRAASAAGAQRLDLAALRDVERAAAPEQPERDGQSARERTRAARAAAHRDDLTGVLRDVEAAVGPERDRGRMVQARRIDRDAVAVWDVDRRRERGKEQQPHARTSRRTTATAVTAAATPTAATSTPADAATPAVPRSITFTSSAPTTEGRQRQRRGEPRAPARCGSARRARSTTMRARPPAGAPRLRRRRPAVDEVLPFAGGQIPGAGEDDRPRDHARPAQHEPEREQPDGQRAGDDRDRREPAGGRGRVDARAAEREQRAERGDQPRACRA